MNYRFGHGFVIQDIGNHRYLMRSCKLSMLVLDEEAAALEVNLVGGRGGDAGRWRRGGPETGSHEMGMAAVEGRRGEGCRNRN